MRHVKTFARADHTAVVRCPQCGQTTVLDVSAEHRGSVEIAVKCPCGAVQTVTVDRRRQPRIAVHLGGLYRRHDDSSGVAMVITSLSRLGLSFETPQPGALAPDERIEVEFPLEEERGLLITRRARVRAVKGRTVGAEFVSCPDAGTYERICDAALAVFLQPNRRGR